MDHVVVTDGVTNDDKTPLPVLHGNRSVARKTGQRGRRRTSLQLIV